MHNYKLLPSLLSILKTRNLSDSAKELNVTQSAMSKTFRQIRDAFGDQIMLREGNQYILTTKGQELQQQLPELLDKLDRLFHSDKVTPANINRNFTVAFSSFVAKSVLPIICAEIEADAPNVSVMSLLWQQEHLDNLPTSDIDVVVTVAEDIPENLYGKLLGQDQVVVMFRQNHPLAKKDLTIEDYLRAKHVQVSGAIGWDKHFFRGESYQLQPFKKLFATAPSFDSAVKVLLDTNTIMTAPLHIAGKYAEKFDLVLREYPVKLPPHKYYLLWHAKFHQDDEHRWFRMVCVDSISRDLQERINFGEDYFNKVKDKLVTV